MVHIMDSDGQILELAPNDSYEIRCCEMFITKLGSLIFHCTQCEAIYGSFSEFLKHIVKVHSYRANNDQAESGADFNGKPEGQYKCAHCQRTFKYSCHLNLHDCEVMRSRTRSAYPCSETTQLFQKMKKESFTFKCLSNTSSDFPEFEVQEDSHGNASYNYENTNQNDAGSQPQSSGEEDIEFYSLQRKRKRPKPYPCPKCKYQYCQKELLERHYDACHVRKHRFQCKLCNALLANKGNMISHLRRHFDSTKRFKCSMCESKFHTRIERRVHEYRHTGERPYICAVCGERFITNSKLKEHMRRHNNERLFKCEHCDKTFFTGRVMRDHMASHNTELSHECTICNTKFKTIKTLKNHIKLHENKREYVCNICGMGFNQRPALVLHKKGKHKVLPIGAPKQQESSEAAANEPTT